ncbi:MAG: glycosyltransferase [Candidatus Berkelbacteria bacterium]|nr:glycosyltransferase [Candidatus Berkelbacteria bacterium]
MKMKILVVGDGHSAIHEVAVVDAFKKIGHQVEAFYWQAYFCSQNPVVRLWRRVQNKLLIGPALNKLNADLIKVAAEFNPKLIFIYRGTHITSQTILALKQKLPDCVVYGYNNDDPFAKGHSPLLWRHFVKSVPEYDLVFAYRHHNLDELLKVGARRVELLRSWYIPEINHPITLSEIDKVKYDCDVVFIGHYENDGRLEHLEEVVRNGHKLRLFGHDNEWNHLLEKSGVLKHLAPVHLVWNEDYNKALAGAKIALCFFSKLNRDTYTRRCFEIPATETLLLSEYSDDLASLYQAGEEADFFKTKEEMIQKIKLYMDDDNLLGSVAANGYQCVINNGHDIVSRMERVLGFVAP